MSITRILGRLSVTTFHRIPSIRHHWDLHLPSYSTHSELRQCEILKNYYRMCDVDERHTVIQAYNQGTKCKRLREYYRKQDIENRKLEAGLLKYNSN